MHSCWSKLILVVMMSGTLLLISCSQTPASPPASPTSQSTSATKSEPSPTIPPAPPMPTPKDTKPYGSLTVMIGGGAGHLDPLLGSGANFIALGSAVWDTLTVYDPKTDVVSPSIAERWEVAPDGMTHTFYIRKGIKFQDGSDLTGADVKYSIERHSGPDSTNLTAPVWRNAIDKVELKDQYTVVLRMKTPNYRLLDGNGTGALGAIVPKKYIEEKGVEQFRKTLVGSGPWKVLSYEPGNYLELEANENYWGKVPAFKNVKIIDVPEEGTRVAMLKTGELDAAPVGFDSVAGLKPAGVRVLKGEPFAPFWVAPFFDKENPAKYPVGDVRVRKALQLSINGQEIGNTIFGGDGKPYFLSPISARAPLFDPNTMKPDPYDPETARRLLAEAGYPDGFPIRYFDVGQGDVRSIVGQALVGYWRKVGVGAETVAMEYSAFYNLFTAKPKHNPQIWPSLWGWRSFPNRDVASVSNLRTFFHSTLGPYRINPNPRLDALIEGLPNIKDPAEWKENAAEAALLAAQGYLQLEVVEVPEYWGVSSKVGGWEGGYRGTLEGWLLNTVTHAK